MYIHQKRGIPISYIIGIWRFMPLHQNSSVAPVCVQFQTVCIEQYGVYHI